MNPPHRTVIVRSLLVLVTAAALTGSAAVAGGERLQVRLEQPFQIGDQRFPSGTITVKSIREYNPSTTFHEVWVDGNCLGLMMARESEPPQAESTRDLLHFRRGDEGQLVLVGFARRNDRPASLYHCGRAAGTARWSAPRDGGDPVLFAASSR